MKKKERTDHCLQIFSECWRHDAKKKKTCHDWLIADTEPFELITVNSGQCTTRNKYSVPDASLVPDGVSPHPPRPTHWVPLAGWPMTPAPTLWPGSRWVCQEGPCEWPSGRVCTPGRRRWKRLWTAGKGDWSALASPSKRIWADKGYDQNFFF